VCLNRFIEETRLDVIERVPVNAFGYWTLLRAQPSNLRAATHPAFGGDLFI